MRFCPMVLLMLMDTIIKTTQCGYILVHFGLQSVFTSLSSITAFHVVSNYYWGVRAE